MIKESLESLNFEKKITFLKYLSLIFVIVFFLRLTELQIIKGDYYRLLSYNNFTRTIILPGRRGMITDRNGQIVCQNRVSFSLLIDTTKMKEIDEAIKNINDLLRLNITKKDIENALRRSPVKTLGVLARDVPTSFVQIVEANRDRLSMLRIEMEMRRTYPFGNLLGHAIGYVGLITEEESKELKIPILDPFQEIGKAGIEKSANAILMGQNGFKRVQVNSFGREVEDPKLKLPGLEMVKEPTSGKSLKLCIDMELQKYIVEAFEGENGSAVFMNPSTGEVYCYVSIPEIDPNFFSRTIKKKEWEKIVNDPRKPLLNRPIQATYPAGSTFKPFIATVGLEEGILDLDTVFSCGGVWEYGGNPFHCWAKKGHGNVDLLSAIQNSCNIFFYKAGDKIGIDLIAKWGKLFGFGTKTQIDLPEEKCGILPSPEWKKLRKLGEWYRGETLPVAIGQGYLAVTPMQILSFYATIANNGIRVKPHLIEGKPEVVMKVPLSQKTLYALKEGLKRVVESGTGRKAKVEGFEICAKTGTAQIVKESSLKDSYLLDKEIRDHAWFAGFAPKDNPKVAFVIMVEHGGHGGDIGAKIAKVGLEYLLLNKKPEKVEEFKKKEEIAQPEINTIEQIEEKEEPPQSIEDNGNGDKNE